MKVRPRCGGTAALNQRGFSLIAILSLVALFAAYLISIGLSRSSADLSNEREDRSMSALRQAKTALIAYAANEQWQLYKGQSIKQPGALPCPDDGTVLPPGSSGLCSGAQPKNRIGRLPYLTIGSDDLRDASGERLWYAVSSSFYKNSGVTVINSDTPGLLTVTGAASASNAVAIVFAPGPAVQDSTLPPGQIQDRSAANINRLESYLEGFTPVGSNSSFATTALPTDTFNDRLLVITQAELMSAVEPAVAARIQRDIIPYLTAYLNTWGRYPFPAAFPQPAPPALSDYQGVAGRSWGLLPLVADPASIPITWINPLSTVVGPPAAITSQDCSFSSATLIDCTVTYSGTPTLSFSLVAAHVGMAFVRSHVIADLTVTASGLPLSPVLSSVNNSPPPDASGQGFVLLSLNMPASAGPVRIRIPPPPLQPSPPTSWNNTMMTLQTPPSALGAGWLIGNQWYAQLFYAVAPDLLPGGGGTCPTSFPCLTVNNLPSPNNNKRAILVFAGRSLNGISPRSGSVANYLENANLSAVQVIPTYVYEHRAGVPTSINDRVVVVSP